MSIAGRHHRAANAGSPDAGTARRCASTSRLRSASVAYGRVRSAGTARPRRGHRPPPGRSRTGRCGGPDVVIATWAAAPRRVSPPIVPGRAATVIGKNLLCTSAEVVGSLRAGRAGWWCAAAMLRAPSRPVRRGAAVPMARRKAAGSPAAARAGVAVGDGRRSAVGSWTALTTGLRSAPWGTEAPSTGHRPMSGPVGEMLGRQGSKVFGVLLKTSASRQQGRTARRRASRWVGAGRKPVSRASGGRAAIPKHQVGGAAAFRTADSSRPRPFGLW